MGSLRPGQQPSDRYDVVCRVFRLKFGEMLQDLRAGALGKPVAFMYTVEWQKRGLPHVHLLLWLAAPDKMRTVSDYDEVVSAEFPDADAEPDLHRLVMDHMVHVPCVGFNDKAPCVVDGKCTKRYPRQRQFETVEDGDGYPLYRRRCRRRYPLPKGGVLVDDRNVVHYNRALLHRFRAHINVEVCSTLHAVKYLHKYIHKGGDRAQTVLENPAARVETLDALAGQEPPSASGAAAGGAPQVDEIRQYLEGRYISAGEAVWRALEFPTHAGLVFFFICSFNLFLLLFFGVVFELFWGSFFSVSLLC